MFTLYVNQLGQSVVLTTADRSCDDFLITRGYSEYCSGSLGYCEDMKGQIEDTLEEVLL